LRLEAQHGSKTKRGRANKGTRPHGQAFHGHILG
jgi:hypothetical protein